MIDDVRFQKADVMTEFGVASLGLLCVCIGYIGWFYWALWSGFSFSRGLLIPFLLDSIFKPTAYFSLFFFCSLGRLFVSNVFILGASLIFCKHLAVGILLSGGGRLDSLFGA